MTMGGVDGVGGCGWDEGSEMEEGTEGSGRG